VTTEGLLLVLAGLLVAAMAIGGIRGLRSAVSPTGYWTLAWTALVASGGVGLLTAPPPGWSPALGALFSPLLLAGCLQHVGRAVPWWLLPGGLALSAVGLLQNWAGNLSVEHGIALGIQPGLLLLSVWILRRAEPHWSLRFIQLGLLGLACVSVVDGLADMASPPRADPILAWLLLGVPTATLQTLAGFERIRSRADQSETERKFEAERFHALLSSLNETPVLLFDRQGRLQQIVGAPREERGTYGLKRAEASRLQVSQLLSPEAAKYFSSSMEDVVSTGRSRTISIEPTFPAGTFCLEVGLSPVHEADGSVESVIGVVHDVTEHVQTVRALRKSEQSLSALLSVLASNRVVVLDRDGVIQSVVAAVKHTQTPYGLYRGQIEGIRITELLPKDGGERVLASLREVFETGAIQELEQSVVLPGGEFHFAVSLRPLLGESGETGNVLAVCTDISERVREERKRVEFEAQVRQAQKLESIGVLAGGIAHDFNNLLTGILGNLELAFEEVPEDGSLRDCLRDVENASIQAADLTAQLLAYAGKTVIAASVIEVGALVQEMSGLLRTGLVGGAELRIQHIGEPAWIRADETQIRQLVMNLVTNAFEALPEVGGRVEIETSVVAKGSQKSSPGASLSPVPGGYVRIEVRDSGCGMDLETQRRIYEPFYTTKFEGRGLGLAGALGIVRSHAGQLELESEPGKGSVFCVLLPRVEPAELAESPPRSVRGSPPRESITVLVLDDDRAVRVVAARMLETLGHRAVCAETGPEALALLSARPGDFDASLIDLTMPDWPGEKAAICLREVREDLPIIFMTGHSERDALERTKGIDRTHFLAKPFRREKLAAALGHFLDIDLA
jgi:PAS domain S-box-containing protein